MTEACSSDNTYREDRYESINNKVLVLVTTELITVHVCCDILDQASEEGSFEVLVEFYKLKTGNSISADGACGWWRAIGQCSMCQLLDLLQFRVRGVIFQQDIKWNTA